MLHALYSVKRVRNSFLNKRIPKEFHVKGNRASSYIAAGLSRGIDVVRGSFVSAFKELVQDKYAALRVDVPKPFIDESDGGELYDGVNMANCNKVANELFESGIFKTHPDFDSYWKAAWYQAENQARLVTHKQPENCVPSTL